MNGKTRRISKFIRQTLTSMLLSAMACVFISYLVSGWQISGNLRAAAEKGNIKSVTITHNGETVTVTEPRQISLAAGCAQILRVTLPGYTTDVTPETNLVFAYKNGKTVQIGADDNLVVKNGRGYSPKGKAGTVLTFVNCTEGIFFPYSP